MNQSVWPSLRRLLILTLAIGAVKFLASQFSGGAPARLESWYLRSGQWVADLRTVGAAVQYLASPDAEKPVDPGTSVILPASGLVSRESLSLSNRPG